MSSKSSKSSGMQAVRLWKISDSQLSEIEKPKLDLEERLEDWMASDISIIDSNLMVIGRQVETEFGGILDILCIDDNGDLIIIELKKDKTPREITAQVVDYASWIKKLTPERVVSIAENYLGSSLDEAFQRKFNQETPESINEEHRMLVVGSEIDSSSRRIINYLSETYRVPINAITFNYFRHQDDEYLARTFLIEPSRAQSGPRPGSKRRPNLTLEQLQEIADSREVGDEYRLLFEELQNYFEGINRTQTSIAFVGRFRDKRRASIFNLIPVKSEPDKGLLWQVYALRFIEFFGIEEDVMLSVIPENREPWKYGWAGDQKRWEKEGVLDEWSGYQGYMKLDEAEQFIKRLSEMQVHEK